MALADGRGVGEGQSIDALVLIDREVDLVSPLVTPLTYEGLIDEVLGIQNGHIYADASLLGEDSKDDLKLPQNITSAVAANSGAVETSTKTVKRTGPTYLPGEKVFIPLNSTDLTFSDIRDLSIEQLGAYLQDRAMLIKTTYSKFRENKDASIVEIHDFVKKIPALTREYKLLTQHINIAQTIRQTTDSKMFRDQWQTERGILEGEAFLDYIEDIVASDGER
jgi:hypothetical protein